MSRENGDSTCAPCNAFCENTRPAHVLCGVMTLLGCVGGAVVGYFSVAGNPYLTTCLTIGFSGAAALPGGLFGACCYEAGSRAKEKCWLSDTSRGNQKTHTA